MHGAAPVNVEPGPAPVPPLNATPAQPPMSMPPLRKLTVPVPAPAEPVTDAVKVTLCPTVDGFCDDTIEKDGLTGPLAATVKVYDAIIPTSGLFCTSVMIDIASSALVAKTRIVCDPFDRLATPADQVSEPR